MEWKVVERDFIERTLKILGQYDEYTQISRKKGTDFEEFEVTLLINCLTGLLVFPYEYKNRNERRPGTVPICNDDTTFLKDLHESWGFQGMEIKKICAFPPNPDPIYPPEDANLRVFIYRLRNSIAHSRFYDGTQGEVKTPGVGVVSNISPSNQTESRIEKLIFRDQDDRFEVIIPVKNLRKFAQKLANAVLNETTGQVS